MKMKMSIVFLVVQLIFVVQAQQKSETNSAPERMFIGRTENPKITERFVRGRCPIHFFQLGEECIFLANDGKIYSWKDVERTCARRIARMVEQSTSFNPEQPNMKPTNGVRPLTLNTPEKTEILRAFGQQYNEQNFAIRLSSDYHTRRRCNDGQDDKWPHLCLSQINVNATCFEAVSHGLTDICVREVDCEPHYLRLACEFTLPGSPELIGSQFRSCPIVPRRRLLPIWAWILMIVTGAVLILVIIAVIIAARKKSNKSPKNFPGIAERPIRATPTKKDPSTEPMIEKKATNLSPDSGYLDPEPVTRRSPNLANNTNEV